jgi:predicted small metal-binding protein
MSHQKIIEWIDWTLNKYRAKIKETHNEQIIIDDIIEELDKKRI